MSERETYYWTAEVAKKLGVSSPTINRYTHALEELGYPILAGTEGRAYTDADIEVFTKMRDLLKNGPRTKTIEVARQALGLGPNEYYDVERRRTSRFHEQSNESERNISVTNNRLFGLDTTQVITFVQSYQELAASFEERIQELEKQLQDRPDILTIREEQMALWNLEKQVESQLRRDAEAAWNNLPEHERTIKKGFLISKRVEDIEKKRWYILNYIQEHKQEEMLKLWEEKQNLLKINLKRLEKPLSDTE